MYNWRKMSKEQQEDVLKLRKVRRVPWHSPPHRSGGSMHYHITAACYEHKPIIGLNQVRMTEFEADLVQLSTKYAQTVYAWAILPNHYHLLVKIADILCFLKAIGKFHGRRSFQWNGEDKARGRKVWCNVLEHAIKSEGHFWATLNYVHHNPVRHGYVEKWQDWPFSNASAYVKSVGRVEAQRVWNEYPIRDYGKGWDPPDF